MRPGWAGFGGLLRWRRCLATLSAGPHLSAALARRPSLSPVACVLQINDGDLGLNPAQWKTTWFKGGSEPGVATLTYMATTQTGHSYVAVALAENPSAPINQATAVPAMLSAVKGAFTLAADG